MNYYVVIDGEQKDIDYMKNMEGDVCIHRCDSLYYYEIFEQIGIDFNKINNAQKLMFNKSGLICDGKINKDRGIMNVGYTIFDDEYFIRIYHIDRKLCNFSIHPSIGRDGIYIYYPYKDIKFGEHSAKTCICLSNG